MKKIFITFVVCVISLTSFAAVKVGDSFVKDGNTYKYLTVTINSTTDYDITVAVTNVTATGNIVIPATVTDSENYICKVVEVNGGDRGLFSTPAQITSVTYPESVKKLSGHLYRFTKMTTISLPSWIESIEDGIGSDAVTAFYFPNGNDKYTTVDGVMFNKDKTELVNYPGGKNVDGTYEVPSGTTKIWGSSIMNHQLQNIKIPASVVDWPITIYTNAGYLKNVYVDAENTVFYDIDGVLCKKDGNVLVLYGLKREATEYTVPSPVMKVAKRAFYQAGALKKLTFGSTVVVLEEQCVQNLNYLEYVKMSKETTDLTQGNPFYSCPKLASVDVEEGNPEYASIDGVLFTSDKETLVFYPVMHGAEYSVPEGTKYIGKSAFNSVSNLTSVTLPTTLIEIKESGFSGCSKLSTVTFTAPNDNFKILGGSAFQGTSALTSITLPASTETIGSFALYNTGLTSFEFPENTTKMSRNGVSNNKNLVSIKLNKKLSSLELGAFNFNPSLTTFDFNGNTILKSLGSSGAFQSDTSLETITYPAQITSINTSEFQGCTNLKHIYFEEGSQLEGIGGSAFMNSGLVDITLPEGFKAVGAKAFENCSQLKEINFPSTVTNLSYDMFTHCSGLEAINVAKGSAKYSSCDGFLLSKDKQTLIIFPAGKASEKFTLLPPSITTIGMYSFYDCDNLRVVTIPKKVTSIESRAFYFCM